MAAKPSWVIFENRVQGWLSPAQRPTPTQGHNISQPPTLESVEQVEAFIADLRESAERVFGEAVTG